MDTTTQPIKTFYVKVTDVDYHDKDRLRDLIKDAGWYFAAFWLLADTIMVNCECMDDQAIADTKDMVWELSKAGFHVITEEIQ